MRTGRQKRKKKKKKEKRIHALERRKEDKGRK